VIGQDQAVHYLREVVTGRVKTPLLLVGEEGTGRRFSVLEAIKEVIAQKRGDSSSDVVQVVQGVHPDVMLVTPQADKELGIGPIRDLIAKAGNHPTSAPCRVFLVEGVDRMTPAAANAILKTLEEPPAQASFFLLAESFDRVIPTIRSRCGRVNFRKLPESFILERLSKFEKDPTKALVYARMGEGSIARATQYWGSGRLSIRDRVLEMLQQGVKGELAAVFSVVDELGKELPLALKFLTFLVHDVMLSDIYPQRVINQDLVEELAVMGVQCGKNFIPRLWSELKLVHERFESSYANLAFQLKTALATATLCG
jgi:DNA polymerase-3 subunit delta'